MQKAMKLPIFASLRGRAVMLVLLAIIPALFLILYTSLNIRQSSIAQARLETLRLAHLVNREHEQVINSTRQLLVSLAQNPALRRPDEAACAAIMPVVKSHPSPYLNFGLAAPDGQDLCRTDSVAQQTNVTAHPWFQETIKNQDMAVSAYGFEPATKKSLLYIGYPLIESKTGRLQAVLFAVVDLNWFDQFVASVRLPLNSSITIFNQDRKILARQPDPEQWVGYTPQQTPVAPLIFDQNGDRLTEAAGVDGILRLYGSTPLTRMPDSSPVYVSVGLPAAAVMAESNWLNGLNLITLSIVAGSAVLLALVGGDLFFRRQIRTLIAASRKFAHGDFNTRSNIPYTSGEFGELARAFDEMAATLQASQSRLTGIINISEDGIIAIDSDQRITLFSQGARRIMGYQADEVMGQPLEILLPEKYRATHHQHIINFKASGDALRPMNVRGAVFGRRKDGTEFPVEASISQFKVGGQLMLVVRLRDITQRIQNETELQQYRTHLEERVETRTAELVRVVDRLELEIKERQRIEAELEQSRQIAEIANRAKSEFLAHMSHELRTPLNGVLGYAQILQRQAHRRSDETDTTWCLEGLGTIQRSGEHLLTLINDILDLSKVEAGRMELHPVVFRLNEFLQMVADMARIQAEQKGLSFQYNLRSPLPTGVKGDQRRLRQVLLNLLGNAIKFTEHGIIVFAVTSQEVNGVSGENSHLLHFEVVDTGIGIPSEQIEDIFQPFRQVDEQHYFEGAGLGLPISRRLAELMGGQLHVDSQPGRGSTFSFQITLPVVVDWADPPSSGEIVGFREQAYKILVVDDNLDNRAVLHQLLAPLGFAVREAADGAEALRVAKEFDPDAILLDLIMPGLSGLEVARDLRQSDRFRDTIIIAVSASAFGVTRQQSLAAGCTDFLSKPVQADVLLDMLQRYLGVTWVYDSRETQKKYETRSPLPSSPEHMNRIALMTGPPPAEAAHLFELAKMGDVVGIRALLTRLQASDERLDAFVAETRILIKSFDMDRICELAKSYMEEGYGT